MVRYLYHGSGRRIPKLIPKQAKDLVASYFDENDKEGIYDVYSEGFSTWAILGKLDPVEKTQNEKKGLSLELFFILLSFLIIGIIIKIMLDKRVNFYEDVHIKNKWFEFESKIKFKFNVPPHKRKFFKPR